MGEGMAQLTNEIIDAAIEGFEAQKRRIDDQIAALRGMKSGVATPATGRRQMSAAGRKAIAEAQRRRWAENRGETLPVKAAKSVRKKRVLSAEGRAAIVTALKKRWAAKKAAAKR
jgi:hypothetical protein